MFNETSFLQKALDYVSHSLKCLTRRHDVTFLCGDTGPLAVAAVVFYRLQRPQEADDCINRLVTRKNFDTCVKERSQPSFVSLFFCADSCSIIRQWWPGQAGCPTSYFTDEWATSTPWSSSTSSWVWTKSLCSTSSRYRVSTISVTKCNNQRIIICFLYCRKKWKDDLSICLL